MKNAQINIMQNADDSSSQTGSAFDVGQVVSASFLGYFGDATATGTLKIQASNDNPAPSQYRGSFVPTNFADIPLKSGDYIDLRVYQNSGASLALLNAAVTNWISIKRIGL